MTATAAETDSLCIRRFCAEYWLSSEHPAPEEVRAALDKVAAAKLPGKLETVFDRLFSRSDEGLWLIRRLEIDVDLNAAWDERQLTRNWAIQIAKGVCDVLRRGPTGPDVLLFPHRGAHLARFLVDLADGGAWGKWYYEEFDGLRMLPVSAAVRTACCDDPAVAQRALLGMNHAEVKSVLRTLTPQDAERVLDALADSAEQGGAATGADPSLQLRAALAGWKTEAAAFSDETVGALHLYQHVLREQPQLAGLGLKGVVLALSCLASRTTAAECGRLAQALRSGDAAGACRIVGVADAQILRPLMGCPRDLRDEVLRAVGGPEYRPQKKQPEPNVRRTPFGGVFLLMPILDTLPLDSAAEGWPDAEGTRAVDLLRLLILARCFGSRRHKDVIRDSLLRDLMRIEPGLGWPGLCRWRRSIPARKVNALVESVADWQHRSKAALGRDLLLTSTELARRKVEVLLDCARGTWLNVLVGRGNSPSEAAPRRGADVLSGWLQRSEGSANVVTTDRQLSDNFPDVAVRVVGSDDEVATGEGPDVSETLARLHRLPNDLAYLASPESDDDPGGLDEVLAVCAQSLLREMAWRLPGFARAGLPYLATNFLDMRASVEQEADRRVVRLTRPPLQVVLTMTGMTRTSYQLSWLDSRPFVLFSTES